MNSPVRHTAVKTSILVFLTVLLAAAMFLSIGSIVRPASDDSCLAQQHSGHAIGCTAIKNVGVPLTYQTKTMDGVSAPQWWAYGIAIDSGVWLLISGILVFGAVLILPEKKRQTVVKHKSV
jgi:hypothetical protein